MIAIFKKEILLFTKNKFGLLTICFLLLIYSLILFTNLFNLNILESGYADFGTFFNLSPIIFLLYIPAVAMKSFSEEFKNDTIDILVSKPISKFELVIGKFLAIYFIIFISLVPTLVFPTTIYFIGESRILYFIFFRYDEAGDPIGFGQAPQADVMYTVDMTGKHYAQGGDPIGVSQALPVSHGGFSFGSYFGAGNGHPFFSSSTSTVF